MGGRNRNGVLNTDLRKCVDPAMRCFLPSFEGKGLNIGEEDGVGGFAGCDSDTREDQDKDKS